MVTGALHHIVQESVNDWHERLLIIMALAKTAFCESGPGKVKMAPSLFTNDTSSFDNNTSSNTHMVIMHT